MYKRLILITVFILIYSLSFGVLNEKYEKAIVLEIGEIIYPSNEEDNMVNYYEKVKIKIKSGAYKNRNFIILNPNFTEDKLNIMIKKGDKVQVRIDDETINIISIDNRVNMVILFLIFIAIIIVLGKFKGVKAIVALLLSLLLILYLFIPLILKGYEPIITALIVLLIISVLSITLIIGVNKKSLSAIIGLMGGILFSGVISYIFILVMRISGYYTIEILNYSNLLENINMFKLITAGIIIGSTGAIMDVAVSISSSLNELKLHNSQITSSEMYTSGMNIGKDIIGTMINTLILAYVGSSMVDILLFSIQKVDYPLIRVLNFEFVIVEFVRAICGSIGILICVPITSYVASKLN
ncbi:MAG: YibE/F family protein [Fusobacteria bacterium]|nr:YibE/F family protein [Fusobacteriota bacterium]